MQGRFQACLFKSVMLVGVLTPAAVFTPTARAADDAKPSWACLPEDTFALLRIPAGNKAAEALRNKTKIGNVLFDPARIDKIKQALAKDESDDFEAFTKELARYHLKLEDCTKLLEGEAGMGLLLPPGDPKLLAVIAWLEPDHDLTGRLMDALDKLLEENKDSELIKRKDIELAGEKVIQLTITPPKPDNDDDQDVQAPAQLQLQLGLQNAFSSLKYEVLLTRKEGRLLMALGVAIPGGDADRDEAVKAARERLKDLFARFLVAHDEKDEGPKLNYLDVPGVKAALPGGLPLLEMMFDFRPLMKMAEASAGKEGKALVKGLGLDELGVLAYRTTFEHSLVRTGLFLSAAVAAIGMLSQLVDGPTLNGKPPAWVPAEMLVFGQGAADLGKVYDRVKQIVADLGENQNTFDMVELQIKQFLGTDLSSLLSSLGTHHSIISLPPKKGDDAGDDDSAIATGSSVFVWKLTDEATWKRVLQTVAVLMQKDTVEEQGFQGIRIDQGQVRFGVFVGRGHLVVGSGTGDSLEGILSDIRNPPTGSASLAGSKLYQRASELLPPKPCLVWSISDGNRSAKTSRKMLLGVMDYLAAVNEDSDQGRLT